MSVQAVLSSVDALWQRRDEPRAMEQAEDQLSRALRESPRDAELLWRAARLHFWRAETSEDPQVKQRFSKQGWDEAESALAARPSPEARYWAAAACGTYAEAIGILKALAQGLEAKFRAHLDWTVAHAPELENGSPEAVLGRYWAQLPWPKRDRKKAATHLRASLSRHPENLRTKLYLAELLLDEGGGANKREAGRLVEEILSAAPSYDPPEERLVQRLARAAKGRL